MAGGWAGGGTVGNCGGLGGNGPSCEPVCEYPGDAIALSRSRSATPTYVRYRTCSDPPPGPCRIFSTCPAASAETVSLVSVPCSTDSFTQAIKASPLFLMTGYRAVIPVSVKIRSRSLFLDQPATARDADRPSPARPCPATCPDAMPLRISLESAPREGTAYNMSRNKILLARESFFVRLAR